MGRRILLTGGAGFIGSNLTRSLLEAGEEVTCLDLFDDFYDPAIKRKNVEPFLPHGGYRLVVGDIRDASRVEEVFQKGRFDALIHLAARAGVRPSIEQPGLYYDVNLQGTTLLLEACRRHGVQKVIFGSSSSVYGNNTKVPFSEEDAVDKPISPYAATKRAGELLCYTYHHLYKLDVFCLRFFTVYGPGQRPEMAIHRFLRDIEAGRALPMFGDGSSRRDYTYVGDIVQGVRGALDRVEGYRIYNLGESRTVELQELIRELGAALGTEPIIEALPDQAGDVSITYADISRARSELGYDPQVDIREGVRLFVEWYRQQR